MNTVKRTFFPSEEWIYFNIHSNRINHEMIVNSLFSWVQRLQEKVIVDRWFYLFFAEPSSSIRFRCHIIDKRNFSVICADFHENMLPYTCDNIIHEYSIGTYEREIERYGSDNIILVEDIFFRDSELSALFIRNFLSNSYNENTKWVFSINKVHKYIYRSLERDSSRIEFVSKMNDYFLSEFGMNKYNSVEINKKYRRAKDFIDGGFPLKDSFSEAFDSTIAPLLKKLLCSSKTPDSLLSDIVHMSIIRLHNNNRFYEMIFYNFLHRIYLSNISRYGFIKESLSL